MTAMRAAIVGTGGIAGVHARVIGQLGGELVGVCGRTLQSAAAFGSAPAYDDLDALLRETRPEVLHICSPNHLHAEHAILAFSRGVHVVCEKPIATSLTDAQRMIDAAAAADRVGAICFNYRGYPLVEVLRERLRNDEFGRLRRIGGEYLCQDSFPPDRYLWHFTPGSVGSAYALMDIGVHWFDLAEYVTGQKIVEICANFTTPTARRVWRGGAGEGPRPEGRVLADGAVEVRTDLEEQADLIVRFDGGASGAVTISTASVGHSNRIRLSVDGASAGFDWDQESPNSYVERQISGAAVRQRDPATISGEWRWMSRLPPGQPEGYLDAFRNVISQAWQAMHGNFSIYPSFISGIRSMYVVESAIRSNINREIVSVDQD